jgi:sugar phosphate isomerase/epimerase
MRSPPQLWTLWAGTVGLDSPLDVRIQAALEMRFDRISLGVLDLHRWDIASPSAIRDLGDRLRDSGLEVVMDPIMNWYPCQDAMQNPFAEVASEATLEAAAQLGAVSISAIAQLRHHLGRPTGPSPGRPPEVSPSLLVDHFAHRAGNHGIDVDLEFMPMTDVRTLADAWHAVGGAGAANGRILVDSWHFFRSGADFDLLATIPSSCIGTVQLSDALSDVRGTLFEDVRRRLLPGDGALDLIRLVRVLSDTGALGSVGPEVINPMLLHASPVAAARLARARTEELLREATESTIPR